MVEKATQGSEENRGRNDPGRPSKLIPRLQPQRLFYQAWRDVSVNVCVIAVCFCIFSHLYFPILFFCIMVTDFFFSGRLKISSFFLSHHGRRYRKQTWMVHSVIYLSAIVQLHVWEVCMFVCVLFGL